MLPPKQPGSKSAEYSSRIESFHQVMLDNIEKEANLIRNVGSFQIHHKNLRNKDKSRRQSSNGEGEEIENRDGGTATPKRRLSSGGKQRTGVDPSEHMSNVNLLKETMNDISIAAASTMKTLKSAIQHTKEQAAKNGGVVVGGHVLPINLDAVACGSIHASAFDDDFDLVDADDMLAPSNTDTKSKKSSDPSSSSSTPVPPPTSSSVGRSSPSTRANLTQKLPLLRTGSGSELMKRMQDAFRKVVVDATATANGESQTPQPAHSGGNENNETDADAWGVGNILANGFGFYEEDDDDGRSRATYDTWDDENSVLRRLGSWGTVNSQFTAGTAGTFGTLATYDTEGPSVVGPVSAAVAAANKAKLEAEGELVVGADGRRQPKNGDQLVVPGTHHIQNASETHKEAFKDDNGNPIDPALVEATLKKQKEKGPNKKKKRRGRRKRLVKFDYPPVKSLRQYSRPNPEDLPNLFFTEDELDQIEDDRYSTMSTDDIEIVAVSSKETGDEDKTKDGKGNRTAGTSSAERSGKKGKEQDYEPGYRPVKGRSSTPTRRRSGDNRKPSPSRTSSGDNNEEPTEPRSPRRLVKGVQIYLRERSTGT